jgi:hypothetical protein
MQSEEIAYIILSFILLATFISIFFFTYVASVEGQMVKTQIDDTIKSFMSGTKVLLPSDIREKIKIILDEKLKAPDMSAQDQDTADNNKKLINQALLIFGVLLGIGVVTIGTIWYFYRFSITNVLKYSFLILCIIALTEFLFVTFVIKNYRLIDQNYLNYLIIDTLESYKNS